MAYDALDKNNIDSILKYANLGLSVPLLYQRVKQIVDNLLLIETASSHFRNYR